VTARLLRAGRSGKVAVVTGASRGIGAGIAAAFRASGYSVVATSRSIGAADETDFLTVRGDIAAPETAETIVQRTIAKFGRIDTLINNAGIYNGKAFTEYTRAEYLAITAVNSDGFFYITQRAIPQMLSQGSGHVVNITTSLVDHARAASPSALTSLTKGGLDAVTRSLATEYASRGVRVNAVALGVIKTATQSEETWDRLSALHPLGRVGEIGDVVDGVLYLEGATFVTGETLHIDGGQAAGH
jgi:NAD(P)-dependent dehydrogenase (short-subunit alcohol dehydrogenase family)